MKIKLKFIFSHARFVPRHKLEMRKKTAQERRLKWEDY